MKLKLDDADVADVKEIMKQVEDDSAQIDGIVRDIITPYCRFG